MFSQKEIHLPTIHFQVRNVSFREGIYIYSIRRVSNHPDLVSVTCWGIQGHFPTVLTRLLFKFIQASKIILLRRRPSVFFFGFVVKTQKNP